jgi:two-component system sensor histidine kinase DegS
MAHSSTTLKEEIVAEFQAEYEKIQARVKENQQLIEQTQLEVSRMRDRNVAISAQLSRVETSFDTVPRADIKSAYEGALDAKTRLLTMQGQLERARGIQEELQYIEHLLGRLLAIVGGAAGQFLGSESVAMPAASMLGDENTSPPGWSGGDSRLSAQAIVTMVEAQEDERRRLARQMHDGPAQSLTNFILQAEICQRLFDRNPDRAGEELTNLKTAASSTFQKVRDFIFDLRPMMLDDLGLVPTIRRYVEAFQEKTDIQSQLNILGDERRLTPHIEVMMFRSIQKVMGNARDNLGAKMINIVLDVGPEWIKATIEHDGQMFDAALLENPDNNEESVGFDALKKRIELVGGTLDYVAIDDSLNQFNVRLPALE